MVRFVSYEEALKNIGAFGKYQKFICLLLAVSTIPNGFVAMMNIFTHNTPPHYCRLPQLEALGKRLNVSTQSEQYNQWLDIALPKEINNEGVLERSKCYRYNSTIEWNETHVEIANGTVVVSCDHGWVYEVEGGQVSIVNEWDLVCSRSSLKPLAMFLYMLGVLFGSFFSGILADRYGRRPAFCWGTLIQFVCIVILSFSTNVTMYCVCLLITGLSAMTNYVAAFVIGSEISDSSKRALMGSMEVAGFTIGYMILPVFAYLFPYWRTLVRITGFGGIIFIPYYWLIPESPRWLLNAGREKEALKIIKKIARVNGKTLVEKDYVIPDNHEKLIDESGVGKIEVKKYTYLDLFVEAATRRRILVMFLQWFTCSLIYYCISLNSSNLGGNSYVVCFIAAGVEIPAYLSMYFMAEKAGRRYCMAVMLGASAISCFLSPFIRQANETASIVVAMFGKLTISAAFGLVYIYCGELFPTMMRNMSIGSSSTMARVGAAIAPYLVFAGEQVGSSVPFMIMGILGMIATLTSICLPETKSLELPENMDDTIAQEKYLPKLVWKYIGQKQPLEGKSEEVELDM